MSEITILLLYLLAAIAFAASRLPRFAAYSNASLIAAYGFSIAGLMIHGQYLNAEIKSPNGLILSVESTLSLVGLQLALIGLRILNLQQWTSLEQGTVHKRESDWSVESHLPIPSIRRRNHPQLGSLLSASAHHGNRNTRSPRIGQTPGACFPLPQWLPRVPLLNQCDCPGCAVCAFPSNGSVRNLHRQYFHPPG